MGVITPDFKIKKPDNDTSETDGIPPAEKWRSGTRSYTTIHTSETQRDHRILWRKLWLIGWLDNTFDRRNNEQCFVLWVWVDQPYLETRLPFPVVFQNPPDITHPPLLDSRVNKAKHAEPDRQGANRCFRESGKNIYPYVSLNPIYQCQCVSLDSRVETLTNLTLRYRSIIPGWIVSTPSGCGISISSLCSVLDIEIRKKD